MVKKLSEMKIGDSGIVTKNGSVDPIKSRLVSMGIVKGALLQVRDTTLTKQTMTVVVCDTDVALRREEAEFIMVDVE